MPRKPDPNAPLSAKEEELHRLQGENVREVLEAERRRAEEEKAKEEGR